MALTKVRRGGTDTGISDSSDATAITIDSSENVMVGHTSLDSPVADGGSGMTLKASGEIQAGLAGTVLKLNREDSNGDIIDLRKDGSTIGKIGSDNGVVFIESAGGGNLAGIGFSRSAVAVEPRKNSAFSDNEVDVGSSTFRFDDVHATNGTIQTSDQNEKQDIASATAKELNVAKKLSTLFKTFRWKDKVTEKGDKARTHTGIIAQEIQSAFSAEGLDASNYGLFTSDTWTDDDGKEQTRLGVRYPELFSFIFSSIEARLTALESK